MYDHVMTHEDAGILPERLQHSIELRRTSPAQLARDSGVSKATISQILSGGRPNTPATIVGKLARALDVSVDYLIGITKDPEPKALGLGELLIELTRIARQLTSRRQRDLLLMARAFLESGEELRGNPDLVMSDLLDLIEESGGTTSRDQLIDLLGRDDDDDDDDPGRNYLPA